MGCENVPTRGDPPTNNGVETPACAQEAKARSVGTTTSQDPPTGNPSVVIVGLFEGGGFLSCHLTIPYKSWSWSIAISNGRSDSVSDTPPLNTFRAFQKMATYFNDSKDIELMHVTDSKSDHHDEHIQHSDGPKLVSAFASMPRAMAFRKFWRLAIIGFAVSVSGM